MPRVPVAVSTRREAKTTSPSSPTRRSPGAHLGARTFSRAKMIEDVGGGGNLGQNDVSANSPVEFFLPGGPDFGLVANPTSVSFAAGGSATSTISLTTSGGFTGTVGLTASSAPAGVATTCVPASISGSQTSTCTFSAANAGSYSVTITGTSGT